MIPSINVDNARRQKFASFPPIRLAVRVAETAEAANSNAVSAAKNTGGF